MFEVFQRVTMYVHRQYSNPLLHIHAYSVQRTAHSVFFQGSNSILIKKNVRSFPKGNYVCTQTILKPLITTYTLTAYNVQLTAYFSKNRTSFLYKKSDLIPILNMKLLINMCLFLFELKKK